jgi:hypothetical protein
MATASDLIRGEALVAQSGNINLGEEIGKGFETVAKSIAEAKSTISSWGEIEAKLNDAMVQVNTDDLLSDENKAVSEFLTQGKLKYAEAARKASRIANKSSKEYKDSVKIMNDINASFKTLAKEKQDILDARAYVKENRDGFSGANSLYEDSLDYFKAVSAEAPLAVNEKGHFIINNKEFRNLKEPSKKSAINKGIAQVFVKVYDEAKKSGKGLTKYELDNAGNALAASIMDSNNNLLAAQQFLLDPIYGGVGLATEEEVKGKSKKELIILAKNRYKELLKEQSIKGENDYVEPEKESKYKSYFDSDDALEPLAEFAKSGKISGGPTATVGDRRYKVVTKDGVKKIAQIVVNTEGNVVEDWGGAINLYKKDGSINFSGFRAYTGSTRKQQPK